MQTNTPAVKPQFATLINEQASTRRTFKIDPEFRSLVPPMSAEERSQLKESIRQHGLLDKLIIWQMPDGRQTDTLLDGHNRFEILRELRPDYELTTDYCRLIALPNHEAAKLWILEHQVGRRNLTKEQRVEMVARIVLMRQEQSAANSKANLKKGNKSPDVTVSVTSGKTVAAAGKEFGVPREPFADGSQ